MSKNRFGKFWNFDPWRPQFWPEPKNDRNDFEMIFRELSNAAFRFSRRRPGAEIMGGAFKRPPPPSRRWKIQRPSRARVNCCETHSRLQPHLRPTAPRTHRFLLTAPARLPLPPLPSPSPTAVSWGGKGRGGAAGRHKYPPLLGRVHYSSTVVPSSYRGTYIT